MKTLLIKKSLAESLIDIEKTIEVVENVFKEKGKGFTKSAPKPFLKFDNYDGDVAVMTTFLQKKPIAGLKIITYNEHNLERWDLPTIMATIILINPENGFPVALMDGTLITTLRTGAAGALGAKYLARKNSAKVSIIGAGVQGKVQLEALDKIFPLEEVIVYDKKQGVREKYAEEMSAKLGLLVRTAASIEEAVKEFDFDILVSAVPSWEPLIKSEWISPGAHITCVGSDEPGKQELDGEIFARARVFVDDYSETINRGAINIPFKNGVITKDNLHELAEVINQEKVGRNHEKEITVFVAAGLPIEDIATAWEIYQTAQQKKVGEAIQIF